MKSVQKIEVRKITNSAGNREFFGNLANPAQIIVNLNERVGSSDQLLRGNLVAREAEKMKQELHEKKAIEVSWPDGSKHHITIVKSMLLGDTNIGNDIKVPRLIKGIDHLVIDAYSQNYSASQGYYDARAAVAEYYNTVYDAGIRNEQVLLGYGVTHFMDTIGKIFSSAKFEPTYVMGEICYPPWAGKLADYGLIPTFVPVDGKYQPLLNESDIRKETQFVILLSGSNPGGHVLDLEAVHRTAEAIRVAMEKNGVAPFLVVDDVYNLYIEPEKRINFFEIAKQYRIPLILLSSFDKVISTGRHGGWMTHWIPPEMSAVAAKFEPKLADEQASFLGIISQTQMEIFAFMLAQLGYDGKGFKAKLIGMPEKAPSRAVPSEEFGRILEKYEMGRTENALDGLFSRLGSMVPEIERNIGTLKGWTAQLLEKFNGNEKYIQLVGAKPEIPLYPFFEYKLAGRRGTAAEVTELNNQLGLEFLRMTGIAFTPGTPFIAPNARVKYGVCFRAVVVENIEMDFDGQRTNPADVLMRYTLAKALKAESSVSQLLGG